MTKRSPHENDDYDGLDERVFVVIVVLFVIAAVGCVAVLA